jgi:hypothetical protein
MTDEEKHQFWVGVVTDNPPQVRFSGELRQAMTVRPRSLDHIESMMFLMEHHPFLPLKECTFGSELLDVRRALAYDVVLRQLAHTRSVVSNANIRNRPGVGAAARCVLEVYALARFVSLHLDDSRLLELLLTGQSFAPGGTYDLERVWQEEHGEAIPDDVRSFLQSLFGAPRVKKYVSPVSKEDEGFSHLYAKYSEYVHPIFGRARSEVEEELGHPGISVFGSVAYYEAGARGGAPARLINHDLNAISFSLELFWPLVLKIDPLFDEEQQSAVYAKLKEQGFTIPERPSDEGDEPNLEKWQ